MTHLDDGVLVAIRDGALVPGDAREHVKSCLPCAAALEEARERETRVVQQLASLDDSVDVERAKEAVRARLDATPARNPVARATGIGHLGRAAAILLVFAGAAVAMPGSPVRTLVFGPEPVPAPTDPGTAQLASAGGVAVSMPDGRLDVVLNGLADGAILDIVLTDTPSARITAAPGSSFSIADGRAEADVLPGAVRLELPRLVEDVSVVVDGVEYLVGGPAGIEIVGPGAQQAGDMIRFEIVR